MLEPQAADLFNMPFTPPAEGGRVYADIIASFAAGRKLDVLEIGVYMGRLLKTTARYHPGAIQSWVGVDPYIGDESDPYFQSYWKGEKSLADQRHDDARDLFASLGGDLRRQMSEAFFKTNDQTFDVVIVDGDHRLHPALSDLTSGLKVLRPGGLLICDDYANSDTPEVTRAAVKFAAAHSDAFDASGFRPVWFSNAGKPFPIMLSVVYWRKAA